MEDFERTWRLIRERLLDQANGAQPRAVASRRTLFGIRSSVEEKMDRFAREIEEEQRAKRDAARHKDEEDRLLPNEALDRLSKNEGRPAVPLEESLSRHGITQADLPAADEVEFD